MTSEPLPSHLPLYCMSCGASLIYTEISTVDGEGSASWKCSGCGEEDKDNWSEFDFTPIDQTNQSAPEPDIEFKLPWPDYPVMLPPPPPLSGGLAMPLTPSYSDIPEDARIVQEQFLKEIQERNKRYEALMRQIEADVVQASIQMQSGEVASWIIRRFNAPLSLAHARANIEGTLCDVGAIGRAAEEIENLLGQLTRLTPDSAVLDQLDRGLKAWLEYIQRGFQS